MRVNNDFIQEALDTANRCKESETKLKLIERDIRHLIDSNICWVDKEELKRIVDVYFAQSGLVEAVREIIDGEDKEEVQ